MENTDGTAEFKSAIQRRMTEMFDEILSFVEVGVPNKYTYDKLRNRVLNASNSAIRDLQAECDKFKIEYTPSVDIINIKDRL